MPDVKLPVVNGWEIDITNKRLTRRSDGTQWNFQGSADAVEGVKMPNAQPPGLRSPDPKDHIPHYDRINVEARAALRRHREEPRSYARYDVRCVSIGEPRTVRSIYVVAQVPDEAVELASASGYAEGFKDFRTAILTDSNLDGPARLDGAGIQAFDITDGRPRSAP